jgi:hypothetical protein
MYDYKEKKIVAIISDKLPVGMAMNALGHLAFSAGHYSDSSLMGQKEISDADGEKHVGISKYPFVVLKASEEEIKNVTKRAKEKKIFVVDYPQEMFDTGPDDELVAALSKARNPRYHAAALVGKSEDLKSLTGHLKLYK